MKIKNLLSLMTVGVSNLFGAKPKKNAAHAEPWREKLKPSDDKPKPSDYKLKSSGHSYKPRDKTRVSKSFLIKRRVPFTGQYGQWLLDLCREQNINKFSSRFGEKRNMANE